MFIFTKILSDFYEQNNKSQSNYSDLIPQIDCSAQIPKRINLIYLSTQQGCELPTVFKRNIEQLQLLNPDWQCYIYTNDNAEKFILDCYGEDILRYYRRIDNDYLAVKADFLRYLIQYVYGGLYIDIKSTLTQPISSNIKDNRTLYVFRWPEIEVAETPMDIRGKLCTNSIFISNAGNSSFRNLIIDIMKGIDRYNPFTDGIGWGGVMALTGPWAFSKSITHHSNISQLEYEIVNVHDIRWGWTHNITDNFLMISHQKMKMNDYRKSHKPIIINRNKILQKVSEWWLYLMALKLKRI